MPQKRWDPALALGRVQEFGEYGGVNASVCDSSTFTFLQPAEMEQTFHGKRADCYLYSRHFNPTVGNLGRLIAAMEDMEACQPTASGMAAVTCALVALVNPGDEIVASRTIYGGTHAFLENLMPQKFGVKVTFVDPCDLEAFRNAMTPRTKVIYTETVSNPLLEVADLPALAEIAHKGGAKLVVDNTFTPMLVTPAHHGADVVVYSLTKFINGASDCVAGAVVGSQAFISSLRDLHAGTAMLFGPTLDGLRASSIAKNLRTLHVRMVQHGKNATFLAEHLRDAGVRVIYPGFESHPGHELFRRLWNGKRYGFGGMVTVDLGSKVMADKLLRALQMRQVGYLAVSLGYYRTLFSAPAQSTSSEVPEDQLEAGGVTPGLARFSVGLDMDMEDTWERFKDAAQEVGFVLKRRPTKV